MKKVLVFFVILAVLAAFAGTMFFLYKKAEEEPVVWTTEQPVVTDIVQKTVATGAVVPRKEVEIKPQISGIIEEVFVEPGDAVRRGDLVARIAVVPDMVSLNSAESRVERAEITLENARKNLERNQRLAQEGTIAESVLQGFEEAFATAEQERKAASDNLDIIRKGSTQRTAQSTNTLVRATIEGMVLEVPVEVGNSVIEANNFNNGTTIATIADMDDMIFEGKVDESEVAKLQNGMALLLSIGAIEGQQFGATLERIAPKGVEENGAIQFEIRAALERVENVFIRANLSANADVVLDRRDQVLALPESLLQFEGDQPYVEVEVAEQSFERRDVQTGLSDGIVVEVLSGVSESDKIKNPNQRS